MSTMSADEYDVDDSPYPIIRSVFETVQELNSVRFDDLKDFISTISLQAIADGRVNVYMNKKVVFASLTNIVNEFLENLRPLKLPILITQNRVTKLIEKNQVEISTALSYVQLDIIGSIQSTIRFEFLSPNGKYPSTIKYPIVCIGLQPPQEDQNLINDFYQFVEKRHFPLISFTSLVKTRTKLERRNREFLIQIPKTRQNLKERYNNAVANIKKKQRQYEVLEEKVASIARPIKTPNMDDISMTIERIDTTINALVETTEKLNKELDRKDKGKQMTRSQELQLLQFLQQQVRDSRSQLEILKEQTNH